jgi:RND family efflux transporter MFP subunit
MHRFLTPSLALASLALASLPGSAAEFTVHPATLDDPKAVFATVETVHVTLARSRVGGTVAMLAVEDGAQVTAGQRIAVVADPKVQLEIEALDQRIRSAQAQRDLTQTELTRARDLYRAGTLPKARVDDAETGFEVANRNLAAQRAERQVVAERHAEGAVLAPASGRVLKVEVTEGAVLMPGEVVARIATENYILRLQLPERHARFIKVGDTVQVGERGLETAAVQSFRPGKVQLVYPQIDNGRVVADVKVEGLGDYFVGERVKVQIATGRRPGFVVPASYLYRRYGTDYVRLKDGSEVVIQLGQAMGDMVEVLSGLRDGDVLVSP